MKLPDSVRVTGDSESAAAHGNHMSEKSALLTLNGSAFYVISLRFHPGLMFPPPLTDLLQHRCERHAVR
jgi:hypothetical protein